MRVGQVGGIIFATHGFNQGSDLRFCIFEDLEVYFRADGRSLAGFDGIGFHCTQHVRNNLCDLDNIIFLETKLGDPGGAQADTRSEKGGLITRDGVAVADDTCQVQNPRGHIAGERCAVTAR